MMPGFQMYLTGKGFKLIENPILIDIATALHPSPMKFSDIVAGSGRPKSTVSIYLKKLEEAGIVRYLGSDDVELPRHYILEGTLFLQSGDTGTSETEYRDIDFSDVDAEDLFDRYFHWFLIKSSRTNGYSLLPGNFRNAAAIGRYGCLRDAPTGFADGADKLCRFIQNIGLAECRLVSSIPIIFEVDFMHPIEQSLKEEIIPEIGSFIAGYIGAINGVPSPIHVGRVEDNRIFLTAGKPVEHTEFVYDTDSCGFSIYWSSDRYASVSKRIDNEVLESLGEGQKNLRTIASELGRPLSSVTDSVKRLGSRGLVGHTVRHGTDVLQIAATCIFGKGMRDPAYESRAEYYMEKMWEEPSRFMTHLRHYEFHMYHGMGFSVMNLMRVASAEFADNFCRHNQKWNAEEIFTALMRNSGRWFLADMSVTSLQPLEITFIKKIGLIEMEARINRELLSVFIVRILRNRTGLDYRLSDSHIYKGNSALHLTFTTTGMPVPPPLLPQADVLTDRVGHNVFLLFA